MRCLLPMLFAGLVAAFTVSPSGTTAQDKQPQAKDAANQGPSLSKDIRPLLKSLCFECHSTAKRKAGLDLEKISTDAAALDWPELWDRVGDRLKAREMPPAKSPQPTEEQQLKLLAWVKHVNELQVSCDKLTQEQLEKSPAGYTMSRRLNRTEYNNSLRDLLGIDVRAGDLLPSEGGGGEGFDNTGGTLFTTPALMEKYLEAADSALAALWPAAAASRDKGTKKVDQAQAEAARKKLLIAQPSPNLEPREAARKILSPFMNRAFRRPVAEHELDRYLTLFEKSIKRGDSFDESIKLVFKGVLISPNFLFLVENSPPAFAGGSPKKEGGYRLDHFEVASHLSYFLWASMPDEELMQLAAAGKLHDEKVLRAQVGRMMRDPRSRGLAESFAVQWLGLRPLGAVIRPDPKLFPEANDELLAAMREETVLFFDSIVREDRSVLDLIDADYTFVNERLAALYKIDGVKGSQLQRVKLDNPVRGGILGQASILTVTSHPHRTSPVLRGRWILEELLGAEVPPPPPNVPTLIEAGDPKSKDKDKKPIKVPPLRQQLEKHRSKAECAACHNKMDPLGFGLENFDPLGRWRTQDEGLPIDTVGLLPTGEKFNGPLELKKLLVDKRRPEFLRNLSRKMLGYGLGREVNKVDMCVVQDGVKALEQGTFRISRLLETIAVSYPFSHRYQKKD